MYQGIVVTDDEKIQRECQQVLFTIEDVELNFISDLSEADLHNSISNILFIILSSVSINTISLLTKLQDAIPDLSLIVYNHSLNISNLNDFGTLGLVNIVIGENRQQILDETIQKLKHNYWRRIPFEQFGINYHSLSPRLQKALKYIESADIGECNIASISDFLRISPGYFSQEFKRETGQSFRKFMQSVLNYYEDLILCRVNLPTRKISQMLGYSELSSFSRSFKKRKGISPTKYKKIVKN